MSPDYQKIFSEEVNNIYRYSYSLVHDKDLAEEITAEAFKRLLEKQDLKPELAKYWLLRVSRNLAYNQNNYNAKHSSYEHYDEAEASDFYPESISIKQGMLKIVEDELSKLPQDAQEVIRLRAWEEMPFADIATLLEEKETTVKLQYYRGMEKLKELVNQRDQQKISKGALLTLLGALGGSAVYAPASSFIAYLSAQFAVGTVASTATAAAGLGFGKLLLAGATIFAAGSGTAAVTIHTVAPTGVTEAPFIYTSKAEYKFGAEQFRVALPSGWQLKEKIVQGKDNLGKPRVNRVDTRFYNNDFEFTIRQSRYLKADDEVGCYFSGNAAYEPYQYAYYFKKQEKLPISGGEAYIMMALQKDQSYPKEFGPEIPILADIEKPANQFELCMYQTDDFGYSVTPFGQIYDIKYAGGYAGKSYEEFKSILLSLTPVDGKLDVDFSGGRWKSYLLPTSEYTSDASDAFGYEAFKLKLPQDWQLTKKSLLNGSAVEQGAHDGTRWEISKGEFKFIIEQGEHLEPQKAVGCYYGYKQAEIATLPYERVILLDKYYVVSMLDWLKVKGQPYRNHFVYAYAKNVRLPSDESTPLTGKYQKFTMWSQLADKQELANDIFICSYETINHGSKITPFGSMRIVASDQAKNELLGEFIIKIWHTFQPADGEINS